MSTTLYYPQSLYFDKEIDDDLNIFRKLYIFYKDNPTGPVKETHFNITANQGITISISTEPSTDKPYISITENNHTIANQLVASTIRFETVEGPKPSRGLIEGGLFFNKDEDNSECNCSNTIKGHRSLNDTINTHTYPMFIGKPGGFIVSIIGVDDIRAKKGGNYNQNYNLEGQELSFMLQPVGTNFDISVKYGSIDTY